MKDWQKAHRAHRDRLDWCRNFQDVLLALDQAGAPAPDDIGAAHADWATVKGVFRIGMTLGNGISVVMGPRSLLEELDVPKSATPETLADIVILWADALRRIYKGGDVPTKTEEHEINGHPTTADLIAKRDESYWQPSKVKR